MKVTIRYFTTLRELAGAAEEKVEIEKGALLMHLIEKITSKYGKAARDYLYHGEMVDPSIYGERVIMS